LLLAKVEKAKFGVGAKASRRPSRPLHSTLKSGAAERAYETRIRFKTDSESEPVAVEPRSEASEAERRAAPSRHIPSAVKRAVWRRDGGQCAFVSAGGRRCTERAFLELHHIHPHALAGPATAANISLRCRRHNQYEAELVFGPRDSVRETAERHRT
jgi:5-methylcytosine-specific restriction endonuclease McrA